MKEHPILFSGPMVRAILEGRKTQTRRVVKPQPGYRLNENCWAWNGYGRPTWEELLTDMLTVCPYGQRRHRLWVRETCSLGDDAHPNIYRADVDSAGYDPSGTWVGGCHWTPSIHMPRWASRITLEIIGVRVERLQGISLDDAIAEGMTWNGPGDSWNAAPVPQFAALWNSINGKRPGCSWADNPWVWVVEFRRVPS